MMLTDRNSFFIDKSVLVVEDSPIIQSFYHKSLNEKVAHFIMCIDGSRAIANANRHPIDIALVDIGLPDMDGVDVAKAIKEKDKNIIVIAVSMRDTLDDIESNPDKSQYFDDFMEKPVTQEGLEDLLRKYDKDS